MKYFTLLFFLAMPIPASAQNFPAPQIPINQWSVYAEQSHRIAAEIEHDHMDRKPCGRINAPCSRRDERRQIPQPKGK